MENYYYRTSNETARKIQRLKFFRFAFEGFLMAAGVIVGVGYLAWLVFS